MTLEDQVHLLATAVGEEIKDLRDSIGIGGHLLFGADIPSSGVDALDGINDPWRWVPSQQWWIGPQRWLNWNEGVVPALPSLPAGCEEAYVVFSMAGHVTPDTQDAMAVKDSDDGLVSSLPLGSAETYTLPGNLGAMVWIAVAETDYTHTVIPPAAASLDIDDILGDWTITGASNSDFPDTNPGEDGDFYLDTFTKKLWKRTGDVWTIEGDASQGQPLNPILTAFADLETVPDSGFYLDDDYSLTQYPITEFGRSLSGSADADAAKTLLEVTGGGGAEIDDVTPALDKVYSSDKTQDALDLKAPLASPTFTGTVAGVTKTHVGLGSADNTSDAGKPVSTAQQTALDLKANAASPAFTGTPTGLTKAHVGLSNVDNTTDAGKPISTAEQTALDLKAPIASPTFTGTVAGVSKTHVGLANVDNTADTAKPVSTAQQTALDLKANLASPTFTGTVSGLTKTTVGLANVDNTADTAKPVSTAQQTALDLKLAKAGGTLDDAANIAVGSTTGTQIATATTQKLGFLGATPVVQQGATTDLGTVLNTFGLRASGTAYNMATSGNVAFSGPFRLSMGARTSSATLTPGTTPPGQNCDATSGNITLTLAATATAGYLWIIKKTDATANTVIIAASFLDTTATSITLTAQNQSVILMSTVTSGTWVIVASVGIKGQVGLGSVDNTADSAKPVSTAQQTALDLKLPIAASDSQKIAMAPPYSTITLHKAAGVWPGVPTTRTDIIIVWAGADPSPSGVGSRTLSTAGFLTGVDLRLVY